MPVGSRRLANAVFESRVVPHVLAVALIASANVSAGLATSHPAQANALTKDQTAALAAYEKALREFRAVLAQRRAQIEGKQKLPSLPGQAVYLARLKVMSTYRNLADAVPLRIGQANKFGVPRRTRAADREVCGAVPHHAGAAGGCAGFADPLQAPGAGGAAADEVAIGHAPASCSCT